MHADATYPPNAFEHSFVWVNLTNTQPNDCKNSHIAPAGVALAPALHRPPETAPPTSMAPTAAMDSHRGHDGVDGGAGFPARLRFGRPCSRECLSAGAGRTLRAQGSLRPVFIGGTHRKGVGPLSLQLGQPGGFDVRLICRLRDALRQFRGHPQAENQPCGDSPRKSS